MAAISTLVCLSCIFARPQNAPNTPDTLNCKDNKDVSILCVGTEEIKNLHLEPSFLGKWFRASSQFQYQLSEQPALTVVNCEWSKRDRLKPSKILKSVYISFSGFGTCSKHIKSRACCGSHLLRPRQCEEDTSTGQQAVSESVLDRVPRLRQQLWGTIDRGCIRQFLFGTAR